MSGYEPAGPALDDLLLRHLSPAQVAAITEHPDLTDGEKVHVLSDLEAIASGEHWLPRQAEEGLTAVYGLQRDDEGIWR